MRKFALGLITLGFTFAAPLTAAGETISLTTYLPPPVASYDQMRISPSLSMSEFMTSGCAEGSIMMDPDSSFRICIDNGATTIWGNGTNQAVNAFANGIGSVALGLNTIADGDYSVAAGNGSQTGATGDYAWSSGLNNVVNGASSVAMGGTLNTAGNSSALFGSTNTETGSSYTLLGGNNSSTTTSSYSTTLGNSTTALGDSNVTFGTSTTGGIASIAFGFSNVDGDYSVGIGNSTTVVGSASTGIGFNTQVTGNFSSCLSTSAICNQSNITVIGGLNNRPSHEGATILGGTGNLLPEWNSTGISQGAYSTTIGDDASSGRYAVGIGGHGHAHAVQCVAICSDCACYGENSIAIGDDDEAGVNSHSYGQGGTIIGVNNETGSPGGSSGLSSLTKRADYAVAIGSSVRIHGPSAAYPLPSPPTPAGYNLGFGTVGIGNSIVTNSNYTVALGKNIVTGTDESVTAIGENIPNVDGQYSVAIGRSVSTNAQAAVAMGSGTSSSGVGAIAMGDRTAASGAGALAMGNLSQAVGNYSVGIGFSALAGDSAADTGATALGNSVAAITLGSTAMGQNSSAGGSGNAGTALGYRTKARGTHDTAMGNDTDAFKNSALSMGYRTRAFGTTSVAFGDSTRATGEYSYAWGINVDGKVDYTVAIGLSDPGGAGIDASQLNSMIIMRGNVGIGYASPGGRLSVNGIARSTGNITSSDKRFKKDIKGMTDSLEKIKQLRGVNFEWLDEEKNTGPQLGLIAQEVEKVFPEFVMTDSHGYKFVTYDKLASVLIEALKEIKVKNAKLKKRLRALETKPD